MAGVTRDIVLGGGRGGIDCVGHCRQGAACSVEASDPARYPAPCTLHYTCLFHELHTLHSCAFPCGLLVVLCTLLASCMLPHSCFSLHSALHIFFHKPCTLQSFALLFAHSTLRSIGFLHALCTLHCTRVSMIQACCTVPGFSSHSAHRTLQVPPCSQHTTPSTPSPKPCQRVLTTARSVMQMSRFLSQSLHVPSSYRLPGKRP